MKHKFGLSGGDIIVGHGDDYTDEYKALVTAFHEMDCHQNHTDGCGWGYESWDKIMYAYKRYIRKTDVLIDFLIAEGHNPDDIDYDLLARMMEVMKGY